MWVSSGVVYTSLPIHYLTHICDPAKHSIEYIPRIPVRVKFTTNHYIHVALLLK